MKRAPKTVSKSQRKETRMKDKWICFETGFIVWARHFVWARHAVPILLSESLSREKKKSVNFDPVSPALAYHRS